VQIDVEAGDFGLGVDPETHGRLDALEQREGDGAAVDHGDQDALELGENLARVAFHQAGGAADGFDGENSGEKRSDNAADTVNAEGVEGVVVTENVFQPGRPEITRYSRDQAEGEGAGRVDVAGGGGDRDQAPPRRRR